MADSPKPRLRDVSMRDAHLLLTWANDPETRRNSFSPREISAAEHAAWLRGQIGDPSSRIWIAEVEKTPIGVIRFALRSGDALVSVTISPEARGRGYGAALIDEGCRRLSGVDITAKIKPENAASIRAFESAGFRRSGQSSSSLTFVRRGVTPQAT